MNTILSKKCQYALHALVHMAENKQATTQVGKICESKNIPRKFLESILLELCKGGLLGSKQGNGGGYFLKRNPTSISLIEIIQLIDGTIDMLPCASLDYYKSCGMCSDKINCRIKNVFFTVSERTFQVLSQTYLSDIANNEAAIENPGIKC